MRSIVGAVDDNGNDGLKDYASALLNRQNALFVDAM
jgi:hypothetical protein